MAIWKGRTADDWKEQDAVMGGTGPVMTLWQEATRKTIWKQKHWWNNRGGRAANEDFGGKEQ